MGDHEDTNLKIAEEGNTRILPIHRMGDTTYKMGDISTVPYSMGCGTTRSICYNMGEESIEG